MLAFEVMAALVAGIGVVLLARSPMVAGTPGPRAAL
jgi:hypothetical protein